MTCEDARSELDDYVDEALCESDREAIAAHLDACAPCAGLAADVTRLREAARSLGPIAPPDQVWQGIARQIGHRAASDARPRVAARWLSLAAAVLVLTAGSYVLVRLMARPPAATTGTSAGNAGAQHSVQTIEQDLQLADRLYSDAIARLEAIAAADAGQLDPKVAANLKQSEAVLDRAIAESRAAIDRDPGNEAARSSLIEALRVKVELLQQTIALVGEMQGGTAGSRAAPGPKSS